MRLAPLEVYILECFRNHHTATLSLGEIVGDATANRFGALTAALQTLELQRGVLRRAAKKNCFELTDVGKKYSRLIGSDGSTIALSGLAIQRWSTDLDLPVKWKSLTYRARVLGLERRDGSWEGRLEFRCGKGVPLSTGEETRQPNLEALEYWATGLEESYLEGALKRAFDAVRKWGGDPKRPGMR